MSEKSNIVIHRDHTFEYNGISYRAIYGGPGWGYEVSVRDDAVALDIGEPDLPTFLTLRELREEIQHRSDNGWPIEHLHGGDRAMNDGTISRYEGAE